MTSDSHDLQAVFPVSLAPGDQIFDYLGRPWTFHRAVAPSVRGKIVGRIEVENPDSWSPCYREFYDAVFPGLVVYGTTSETSDERGEDNAD